MLLPEYCSEHVKDSVRCRIAVTREIQIACAAGRLIEPCCQQHGPLQHETVGVRGLREPVEEALDRIVRQDQIEVLTLLLADSEEASPDRGPDTILILGIGGERLEVRADHCGDTATLRVPGNLGGACLSLPECLL